MLLWCDKNNNTAYCICYLTKKK